LPTAAKDAKRRQEPRFLVSPFILKEQSDFHSPYAAFRFAKRRALRVVSATFQTGQPFYRTIYLAVRPADRSASAGTRSHSIAAGAAGKRTAPIFALM
jgi:hypothetical protein